MQEDEFQQLYSIIRNKRLSALLTDVKFAYENGKDYRDIWNQFLSEYQDFLLRSAFSESKFQLKDMLRGIQNVFLKLKSDSSLPPSNLSDYNDTIIGVQEYIDYFRQQFASNQFSHQIFETAQNFASDMETNFLPVFLNASIEKQALASLLKTLKDTTETFVKIISIIPDNAAFPSQVTELDHFLKSGSHQSKIQDFEDYSSGMSTAFDKLNESTTAKIISQEVEQFDQDDLSSNLKYLSSRLEKICKTISSPCAKELRIIADQLHTLSQSEIENQEVEQLRKEIKRNHEMIHLLNQAASMRTNLDMNKLHEMTHDQLIAIIQTMSRDQNPPVRISSIPRGASAEYADLWAKYKESAEYGEKCNIEIQQLQSQLVTLQSENFQLKTAASAASAVEGVRQEIDAIDEKAARIEEQIRVKIEKNEKAPVKSLRKELNDIALQRAQLQSQIDGVYDKEAMALIETLKKENHQMKIMLDQKIKENSELQGQISELAKKVAAKERQPGLSPNKPKSVENTKSVTKIRDSQSVQQTRSEITRMSPLSSRSTTSTVKKSRSVTPPARMNRNEIVLQKSPALMGLSRIPAKRSMQEPPCFQCVYRPKFRL